MTEPEAAPEADRSVAETVQVLAGQQPRPGDADYREMWHYESGRAEADAAQCAGPHREPWLNVREYHEPGVRPALLQALSDPRLGHLVRGRVIDLGAGTCWAASELSKLDRVAEVVAVDLSEGFLRRVGVRMIRETGGALEKVSFVAGSYEAVPAEAGSFQSAFLIASIHHAVAPLRVLAEVRRLLAPGGVLIVIENPSSILAISTVRERALELSHTSDTTEIAYTRGELHYLLRHAGFSKVTWVPVEGYSRNPLKRLARSLLRRAGVEHWFLSATYVISAENP